MFVQMVQLSISGIILSNAEKHRRSGVRRTEQARRDLIEARTRARNCPQG